MCVKTFIKRYEKMLQTVLVCITIGGCMWAYAYGQGQEQSKLDRVVKDTSDLTITLEKIDNKIDHLILRDTIQSMQIEQLVREWESSKPRKRK